MCWLIRCFKFEAGGDAITFFANEVDFWDCLFDKADFASFGGFADGYFLHVLEFGTYLVEDGCDESTVDIEEIEIYGNFYFFLVFGSFVFFDFDEFAVWELFEDIVDIFDLSKGLFGVVFIYGLFAFESVLAEYVHDASVSFVVEYGSP